VPFRWTGTPTDCVLLAIGALIARRAELGGFSGVNHGPNMGEDVLYSGPYPRQWRDWPPASPASHFLRQFRHRAHGEPPQCLERLIQRIVRVENFPGETLLNINFATDPGRSGQSVKVTNLGSRVFHEEIATMKDPWGREVH